MIDEVNNKREELEELTLTKPSKGIRQIDFYEDQGNKIYFAYKLN